MLHLNALQKEIELIDKVGKGNAHLVWSMGLYLDHADLIQLASESLTDQGDDKKIDFIRLDSDAKKIIFAQGYCNEKGATRSGGAPSNKAADLNTAAAWLISGDIQHIPENLRAIIADCRKAIENDEIEQIDLLYVHNLPESPSVAKELITASTHLEGHLKGKAINVVHKELGIETLERLFTTQETAIAITEKVDCPGKVLFAENGPKWKAGVLSVSGSWLKELFQRHGEDLFSANYRGFLGITKRRKINSSIMQTAESDPENFWVFNNGITILTLGMKTKGDSTELSGISIINGAQTSGSIGSSDGKHDLKNLKVMCRIIDCSDKETIAKIVRFNNTQNVITTWDAYSNSEEQKRIQKEFADLGYGYSLKRGFSDASSEIGVEQVAASLIAITGDFKSANIGKNYIFETKYLYNRAFQSAKARHILFSFALSKAIDERRLQLKTKSGLIEVEQKQLQLLRNMRFKNFVMAVLGKSLETIIGDSIDIEHIGFIPRISNKYNYTFNDLIGYWMPVSNIALAYIANTINSDFSEVLKDENALASTSKALNTFIYTTQLTAPNPSIVAFKDVVSPKG